VFLTLFSHNRVPLGILQHQLRFPSRLTPVWNYTAALVDDLTRVCCWKARQLGVQLATCTVP